MTYTADFYQLPTVAFCAVTAQSLQVHLDNLQLCPDCNGGGEFRGTLEAVATKQQQSIVVTCGRCSGSGQTSAHEFADRLDELMTELQELAEDVRETADAQEIGIAAD